MATVKFKGNPVQTSGQLPAVHSQAPAFTLVKGDLSELSLADLKGKRVVLNIFPSIDTGVCAASVRRFNKLAGEMANTVVLCISEDLPFASSRFCAAEGLANVVTLSAFRSPEFDAAYGVKMTDGPLKGLFARSVVVIDAAGNVLYEELVPEITNEPNYAAVLEVLA